MSTQSVFKPLLLKTGDKGVFKFDSGFAEIVNQDEILTVSSVIPIVEFNNTAKDIMSLIYKPAGLTEEDYMRDVGLQTYIVSFIRSNGTYKYVPNTYITKRPKPIDVPYQDTVLVAYLGPLPIAVTLDNVLSNIENVISIMLGIKCKPSIIIKSSETNVDIIDHAINEATRDTVSMQAMGTTNTHKVYSQDREISKLRDINCRLANVIKQCLKESPIGSGNYVLDSVAANVTIRPATSGISGLSATHYVHRVDSELCMPDSQDPSGVC